MTKPDIDIAGRGFYQITGLSARGRRWLERVEGAKNHVAYCDDTRLTQNIADGARAYGLHVQVNGRAYGTECV